MEWEEFFKMKGSKNWWIAYCYRGVEHRESCGSPHLKDAKDLLKQRLQQMGADVLGLKAFVGPVENRITVDNMLDALQIDHRLRRRKALPQFQSHLKRLREYFGNHRAVDVTSDIVDRYIEIRSAEKSPATVNREISLLRQAFRVAMRQRKLTMAPEIRRLEESNVRQGFFEAADFLRTSWGSCWSTSRASLALGIYRAGAKAKSKACNGPMWIGRHE